MMPSSKGNPFITDHVARSAIQTLVERCDALEARVKALEEWMPKDRLALAALAEPFTTSRTQPLTKFSKIRRKKA